MLLELERILTRFYGNRGWRRVKVSDLKVRVVVKVLIRKFRREKVRERG